MPVVTCYIWIMKINYLLKDGRLAIRVRKPLRAFVDSKEHRNNYINDLIAKDAQKRSVAQIPTVWGDKPLPKTGEGK